MRSAWFRCAAAAVVLCPVAGCGGAAPAENRPAPRGPVALVDVAGPAGVRFTHTTGTKKPLGIVETMGSGAAFLDFDGDGWIDLFLVNAGQSFQAPAQQPGSRLFRNLDGTRFEDVTEKSGLSVDTYGMGCCAGDYDGDGDMDLYVTGFRRDQLFRNEGNGRFRDVTATSGFSFGPDHWGTGCSFLDADGDGDLDLYAGSYVVYDPEIPLCPSSGVMRGCTPNQYRTQASRLWINEGGRFVERAAALGADDPDGASLGVTASDFDNDGRIDLFVANDGTPNALLMNRGRGFINRGDAAGVAYAESGAMRAGMGADAADINADGRFDLIITNFQHEPNSLYRNDGGQSFSEITYPSGVGEASILRLGFGVVFADLNGDGHPDLYVGNGHVYDNVAKFDDTASFEQLDQVLLWSGGRFVEHPEALPGGPSVTRGVATGDFNNDGAPDLLINSLERPARLLRNDPTGNSKWFGLDLQVKGGSPVGARVELRRCGPLQVREVRSGGSYLSQSDMRLLFRVAGDTRTEDAEIRIRWPGGARQTVRDLKWGNYQVIRREASP